jgi:hypothetical protein
MGAADSEERAPVLGVGGEPWKARATLRGQTDSSLRKDTVQDSRALGFHSTSSELPDYNLAVFLGKNNPAKSGEEKDSAQTELHMGLGLP